MEKKPIVTFFKTGKKGAGLVSGLVMGIVALVIAVIIGLVIVQTLSDASLLGTATTESNSSDAMIANLTTGIDKVSAKLPTILLIAAVVLILGVLVFLWAQYKRMNIGGGGEL